MAVLRTREGALTERVARALLGAPDGADPEKGEVRFGDISVNLSSGRFYYYDEEASGTHIDLIRKVKGLQNGQAEAWLEENVTKAPPIPLPRETEAERALIGLLVMRPDLMAAVEEEITAESFAEIIHRQIFAAIAADTRDTNDPISLKALIDAAGGDPLMPVAEG